MDAGASARVGVDGAFANWDSFLDRCTMYVKNQRADALRLPVRSALASDSGRISGLH
jgi:hypothetical protein